MHNCSQTGHNTVALYAFTESFLLMLKLNPPCSYNNKLFLNRYIMNCMSLDIHCQAIQMVKYTE